MRASRIHEKTGFVSVRLLAALLIAATSLAAFKLFEPVFVYKWGWEHFPRQETPPMIVDLEDGGWSQETVQAETLLKGYYGKIDAPAISMAVSVGGKLIWRSAIGFSDLNERRAISFEDRFRIGSTSKAITAVAAAAIADRGGLEFDTPMGAFDPSLAEQLQSVTLAQVMSHRAGIRNYGMCFCFPAWEHLNRRSFSSVRESVSVIEKSPLRHAPGTKFQYTSLGYNLAGLAIERAAGKPFGEALEDEVFTPLGMNNSSLELKHDAAYSQAIPYEIDGRQYKKVFAVDNSIRWPSGGILSTPTDMIRLGGAMLNTQLLSDEARARILTIPEEGRRDGGEIYALGWRVSDWRLNDQLTVKSFHHNGVAVGGVSVFVVFPDQNIVISAMMNKNAESVSELTPIVNRIALLFMHENFSKEN